MKIVAIGGGEIGRPGKKIETEDIDKRIIELTEKENPKALFIPTASSDSEGYWKVFQDYYGNQLGCEVDVLNLLENDSTEEEIRAKVFANDLVYVGGGNTRMMLEEWKRRGLDKILEEAGNKGIVLSGLSAGAICWCKYGNSDAEKFNSGSKELIKLEALGFLPLMICPHYNVESYRRPSLHKMIEEKSGVAIALDNCVAIEYIDGKCKVITFSKDAKAYLVYKSGDKVIESEIPVGTEFSNVQELM